MKPGLLMLPSAVSDSRVHNILPNKIETDFQFSRASAATRVNHQGLIENVGYFSDELVQNGNFSELGSELVTNGDFATDSNWAKGSGWTINNGKASVNTTTINVALTQDGIITVGKTYKVIYEVKDFVAGSIRVRLGDTWGSYRTANGTYTEYLVATTNTDFRFYATAATTELSIDNVSVKQVDPNDRWSLGTGWGYGNGVASRASQSGSSLLGANGTTLTVGKTYKCTMTVSNYSNGAVRFATDNFGFTLYSANGTYTEILTSTGTAFNIKGNADFAGSVTNISVVEVIGDKPRLDYDPLNPTCPHLLLEPQSTNLLTFSNDYTQSFWVKQQVGIASAPVVTSNYAISPDGTKNADRVVFNLNGATNSDFSQLAASLTTSVGNITNSVYIKSNTDSNYVMNFTKASGANTLITVTNEWQRFEATLNNTTTSSAFRIRLRGTESTSDYADVSIYGAQLEQQAYATSLIPTAGAAETRVAETCKTAGNVDTFNNAEGVLYTEIASLSNDAQIEGISISDGTSGNRVVIFKWSASNTMRGRVTSGGTNTLNSNFTVPDITSFKKIAIKYKVNDFAIWLNGDKVITDLIGAAPTALNVLAFSSIENGGSDFYGKVKSLATYNRALTDTELYTITSTQYSAYSGMVAALGNYTIPC